MNPPPNPCSSPSPIMSSLPSLPLSEPKPQPHPDPNPNPPPPGPTLKIPSRPLKIRKLDTLNNNNNTTTTETTLPTDNNNNNATTTTNTNNNNYSNKMLVVIKQQKQKPVPTAVAPRIISRRLSAEGEIEKALRHLKAADPENMGKLIETHQPPTFDSFQTPFLALTKSILYQQLAYKAGTSIYSRFVALCGGEAGVVPDTVIGLTQPQLRQIGVSARKTSYLHDLARKYKSGILNDSGIVSMDDRSLFTMLTMVNGIGSWSVHMFMIFSLHRPDVLPVNDLGVRKGVQLLFGLEELPRPSQMDQLCEKWRPFRSVASWYLWRFVEAKGSPSTSAAATSSSGGGAMLLQHQQHLHHHQQQPVVLQHPQQSLPQPHPQQHQQHQQQQHQHQQHQQQQHLQTQSQFLDPINGIMNLG